MEAQNKVQRLRISPPIRKKVFIVNRRGHDFSRARRFGELVYMTEGLIDPAGTSHMYRTFSEALSSSSSNDLLLTTSLTQMNVVAGCIFAMLHKRLNLLIWLGGDYVIRELTFEEYAQLRQ